jgi:hypothetical protein
LFAIGQGSACGVAELYAARKGRRKVATFSSAKNQIRKPGREEARKGENQERKRK